VNESVQTTKLNNDEFCPANILHTHLNRTEIITPQKMELLIKWR
jgi:hypothetical protein